MVALETTNRVVNCIIDIIVRLTAQNIVLVTQFVVVYKQLTMKADSYNELMSCSNGYS